MAVPTLEARGVTVLADGRALVRPTSFAVPAGHLMALIGPSGAGKTTLLRALAGVTPPNAGTVLLDGEPLWRRSTEVAYVPSDDLLHDELSVYEELFFAAALRAPASATDTELDERVEEVLADLHMADLGQARVATLSTGQRRRVGCGIELVGRPTVLLLDEPAGGLDASLERRLMELLRGLADEGRGVLAATHATASLAICDSIAVMATGGSLIMVGTPAEVLEHFGVGSFAEVYELLGLQDSDGVDEGPIVVDAPSVETPIQPAQPLTHQLRYLAARYARCVQRDTRTLRVLIVQAPILGVSVGLVLPRSMLDSPTTGPYYHVLYCFLLLTGSIWLGTISACREIVEERAITWRESAVGLRLDAYVLSKCLVLFPLAAFQTLLLVCAATVLQPLPGPFPAILGLCILTSCAAVTMGLWLSAYARSPDQATSSVPLLLIPQLLFAGALIPFSRMPLPIQAFSDLMISRWALTGLGERSGFAAELTGDVSQVTGFEGAFFSVQPLLPAAVIVAFALIGIAGAGMALDRQINR